MILKDGISLYHGSYTVVRKPDLSKCRKEKDFGQGFYVTTSSEQAERFVKSSVHKAVKEGILDKERKYGYVSVFQLIYLNENVKVYEFKEVNEEWLHCIISHRRPDLMPEEYSKWKDYDILAGKIANDNTNPTINFYISGAYGMIGSKKAVQTAIEILKPFRLHDQLCFRTEKSFHCLKCLHNQEVIW